MQTTWTQNIDKGLPGLRFGTGHEVENMVVESGEVPFGYGVTAGSEDEYALLPSGGETVVDFRGVAELAKNIPREWRSSENPKYNAEYDDVMGVIRKRMVLVVPTAVVVRGDPVFWQIITAGSNYAGTFRNTADGGNAIDISSVASWFRGNETLGGLAVLNLNILK